jgi:oxygen-dependent protoporphyrinogen oxidase
MAGEPLAALRSRAPGTLAETYGGLIGRRAMRRLIAPFAEGVLGSPAEVLADDVVPRPENRSLAFAAARQGLQRRRPPVAGGRGPGLMAAEGGMQRVVNALAASTEVRLGVAVTSVTAEPDGTFVVRAPGESFPADAVVVAVPAPVAGWILAEVSGSASRALGGVATSSSVVLHVDVVPEQQDRLSAFDATGWLAAPEERAAVSAASFVGVKWPHLRCPGRVRAVVRRPDLLAAPDEQLLCVALDELERVLGLHTERHLARLHRWSAALPVRAPGTAARVAEARAQLPRGIELAGTAHAAVGVTAAVTSGRRAAERVVA